MLYLLLDQMRAWLVENNLYWLFRVLDQLQFRALAASLLAFLLVTFLGRPFIRWLKRKKIGDSGLTDAKLLESHSTSKKDVPTMGGLLIAGSIGLATFLLADVRQFYVVMGLIVLVWLAALGSVDDWLKLTAKARGSTSRQGLHAWEKLVFQLGLGLLVGLFTYNHGDSPEVARDLAHVLNLPFQKTYQTPALSAAEGLVYLAKPVFVMLAVLVVAGMSNAVNITDGMDGLASGITTAVSVGLFVLAMIAGSQATAQWLLVPHLPFADELSVLAGAMAGACLGFLWWNCSPAQVFMGDTGSLCLGGLIGYIAIALRQEIVVLLMCGVFLLECGSVAAQVGYFKLTRRLTGTGRRIFHCAPYHHHLHIKGWTEQQVVARLWIISILLVVAGLASIKLR